MALTPYKSSRSPLNRIRSSSCSSPVRNQIVYQEIYSVGFNTLVRSYSCDQVLNKDETGRTFQTTHIQISSFITPDMKTDKATIKKRMKTETDLPRPRLKFPEKRMMLLSLVPIVSAWVLWSYLKDKECGYVWDLKRTKTELMDNLFGQGEAVAKIISVLKEANDTSDFHVMIFTGGVGVGKTFSSSIIGRNFPWSSNKLITYSEHFNSNVEKLLKSELSSCGCNMITVDDLTRDITSEPISLIRLLNSKRKPKEKLLLTLIYQVHDESDRKHVIEQFKNAYVNFHHIPFKSIMRDVVKECFSAEIQRHDIAIPENELNKLIDEKMKFVDVAKGPVGCKGVTDDVLGYYNKNQQ